MIKKNAFTLIEIIIALIISAMIGVYIIKQQSYSNFKDSVEKFGQNVIKIISVGVMNNSIGYAQGGGDPCSDNKDYFDAISASKVIDCLGWQSKFTKEGDYFDGVALLGPYTSDGHGCKFYFDSNESTTTKFTMFIDCSNVNYKNEKRYKKYVEDRLEYILKSNSSVGDSIAEIKREATSLSNESGGTRDDGKIMFKFDSSLH